MPKLLEVRQVTLGGFASTERDPTHGKSALSYSSLRRSPPRLRAQRTPDSRELHIQSEPNDDDDERRRGAGDRS
jgi:hypothetical protein